MIESKLLSSTEWAFLSPRLFCYWPFTIRPSANGAKKIHSCYSWNYGIPLSATFLLLNIIFLSFYGRIKGNAYFNNKSLMAFDVYCIVVWDSIIMTNEIVIRIYCLLNLHKLNKFWERIVTLTTNYFEHSSQPDVVEHGLRQINNWAKTWTLLNFALVSVHLSCFIYPYISGDEIRRGEDGFAAFMNVYMEVVMCFHNVDVLFLIYFIKIMILGFDLVSSKIQETVRFNLIQREARLMLSRKKSSGTELHKETLPEMKSEIWVNSELTPTLNLLQTLENIVESFNETFSINMLGVVIMVMSQAIFAVYFLYCDPRSITSFTWAVSLITPLILCPCSLVSLCFSASKLADKCYGIMRQMQGIPLSCMSREDQWSVQLTVTRLSGKGVGIYVGRLFQIRASLLTSAVSTFATYFIIIIQMQISSRSQKINNNK
ncbi:hypothetical protein Ocin01_05467 [Orchesella cincta]|uniref:Gustatory receptor n=1 Tax=Orchesella cincta TaxID=48709 RepID=A0A1D2N7H4_ORCCI|nr:hypothetical protein Ocin01_05467 [Orchesella cincta]